MNEAKQGQIWSENDNGDKVEIIEASIGGIKYRYLKDKTESCCSIGTFYTVFKVKKCEAADEQN